MDAFSKSKGPRRHANRGRRGADKPRHSRSDHGQGSGATDEQSAQNGSAERKDRRRGRHQKGLPPHLKALLKERFGSHQAVQTAVQDQVFEITDTDGNGELSRSEISETSQRRAHKQAMTKVLFETLDANADGQIDASEFPSPAQHLRAIDTDQDGKVSRKERREARAARSSGAAD